MKIFSTPSSSGLLLSAATLIAGLLRVVVVVSSTVVMTASSATSFAPTESLAAAPNSGNPTTTSLCGDDVQVLTINVKTGYFYYENEWILEKQGGVGWEEVASNPLDVERYMEYQDRVCLEPSTTYRWTITDASGDGMLVTDPFSVFVDEEQIFQENYDAWFSLEVIFVTPSDPSGSVEIRTASPSIGPSASPSRSPAPSDTPTESSAPSDGPTVFGCYDEDLLNIDVYTDPYSVHNSWVLDEKDPITSAYFRIASNDLLYSNTLYQDRFCLEPGVSYRWTLTEDRGDVLPGNGFNCNDYHPDCGYSVKLNGEEIVSNGRMFDEIVKEIGPIDCSEDVRGFHRVENPRPGRNKFKRVYCSGLQKLIKDTRSNEGCFAPLIDGSGYLYDKCKKTCGRAAAGPCAA